MSDVTRILNAIEQGDARAAAELLPLVYEELRCLAARKLSHEPPGQTLQATALVHEAYLRLVGTEDRGWQNKGHFFTAAAEAMRRILIDNARKKKTLKHGGDRQRIELDECMLVAAEDVSPDDMLAFDETLAKLAARDKTKADLVKLCVFAGLTGKQAAAILGVSQAKVSEDLAYARAWLALEINKGEQSSQG